MQSRGHHGGTGHGHLGWSRTQAEEFRASIWQGSDFPVWEEFIRRTQSTIGE